MSATKKRWPVYLGMLGIFVAGVVTGLLLAAGAVHHHWDDLHSHGPAGLHRFGTAWLEWNLDLTDAQHEQVDQVMHDLHMDLFRFKSEHNAEIDQIVSPALARIDAILDAEQMKEWKPMRDRVADHLAATLREE